MLLKAHLTLGPFGPEDHLRPLGTFPWHLALPPTRAQPTNSSGCGGKETGERVDLWGRMEG